MIDLEEMLRKRQDELRGRPEDWIDRLGDWRRRQDWVGIALLWLGPLIALLALILIASQAHSRDLGQWEATDPAVRQWYQGLMQPDVPTASCCGEADAYWCDEVHVREGHSFCAITDDRDDASRGRPHRDIGEQFEIPPNKLKYDKGNPTGHHVIFLSRQGYVYCFVMGSGA